MRVDATPYSDPDFDRNVVVTLWAGASVEEIFQGSATGDSDVSDFTHSIKITDSSLKLTLTYDTEFATCGAQPKVGHLLSVSTDGYLRYLGIISTVDAYYEERGERRVDLTARARDGMGGWKTQRAVSPIFPLGTNLTTMLTQIATDLMALGGSEYSFPSLSFSVPHTNAQFNDETPWNMISTILEAGNYVPVVNVLNQVTAYSKDFSRAPNVSVGLDRLISKSGASQRLTYDRVRLKWLDPKLSKSLQQSQLLYSTAMTAGFFDRTQKEETWWSDDHRQRAESVTFKIVDSVNSGIVDVADEDFELIDEFHGEIKLQTYSWVPTLFVLATATLLALAAEPDAVVGATDSIPTPFEGVPHAHTIGVSGGATTLSIGRIAEAAALSTIIVIMMSIGVGRYEIWGVPYDYVHAKNTMLAYADNLPTWLRAEKEIENDLITGEAHAESVAVTDLIFESAKGTTTSVEMIDDPRIEVGDLLNFSDGTRLFVTGFSNDFTRGSSAVMKVEGMLV